MRSVWSLTVLGSDSCALLHSFWSNLKSPSFSFIIHKVTLNIKLGQEH